MRLFDERIRDDDRPLRADEDTFAFLNRVDDVYFSRVREQVEEWFANVPADEQATLRGRLRSRATNNSAPTFWELYLRELLRQSGFALTHEPQRDHRRRPDFLAVGDTSFYVEARLIGAPEDRQRRAGHVDQIKEQLQKIASDDYGLHFDIRRYGSTVPALGPLRRAVEDWLAGLVYEDVVAAARAKAHLPEKTFPVEPWTFWFRAVPRPAERRGRPWRVGPIIVGPVTRVGGSGAPRVADALKQKAGRYGDLDAPYLIALCTHDVFIDQEDLVSALYGTPAFAIGDDWSASPFREPTGLFSGRGHPRVSAVLVVRELRPWLAAKAMPVLWHNPNALHPFEVALPWAGTGTLRADGTIEISESAATPGDVLGIAQEWPGPEGALRVRAGARLRDRD